MRPAGLAFASLAFITLGQATVQGATIYTVDQGDTLALNDGAIFVGLVGQEGDKKNPEEFLEIQSVQKATDGTNNANGFAAGFNDGDALQILDTATDPDSPNQEFRYQDGSAEMIVLGETLTLADVPRYTLSGVQYFVFLFDGNESDGFATTYELEVWTSGDSTVTTDDAARSGNLAYDLDSGEERTLEMSAQVGTSNWNVVLFIPFDNFTLEVGDTTGENTYVHLYHEYTDEGGGVEQWGTDAGWVIPEPSGIMLLSLGAVATLLRRRRA